MEKVLRTIQFRLYPTKLQENKFLYYLRVSCDTYNHLVNQCMIYSGFKLPFPSFFDINTLARKYRHENSYEDVHSHIFSTVAKRVSLAFNNFFRRVKSGERPGYPRFKSYSRYDSFSYDSSVDFKLIYDSKGRFCRRVRLGLIGEVKCRNDYTIKGKQKFATIIRRKMGTHYEWYLNIVYDVGSYYSGLMGPHSNEKPCVGIDLGIGRSNLVMTSDNTSFPNEQDYIKKEKVFSKYQRKLSNLTKGTEEYLRVLGRVQHSYKKLKNSRNDRYHKLTITLAKTYSKICMEDINIVSLQASAEYVFKKKSFRDASWGEFTKLLTYKVVETGSEIIFVNPAYTSQRCSRCHIIVNKGEKDRIHSCPYCGLIIDRDLNAARNILDIGLGSQAMVNNLKCKSENLSANLTEKLKDQ